MFISMINRESKSIINQIHIKWNFRYTSRRENPNVVLCLWPGTYTYDMISYVYQDIIDGKVSPFINIIDCTHIYKWQLNRPIFKHIAIEINRSRITKKWLFRAFIKQPNWSKLDTILVKSCAELQIGDISACTKHNENNLFYVV